MMEVGQGFNIMVSTNNRVLRWFISSKWLCLFVLAVFVPGLITSSVLALPSDDIDAIYRDSVHYAVPPPASSRCGSDSGTEPLVGSENAEKSYNFLVGQGLTPEQAAGIAGNLAIESAFIPNRQEVGQTWGNGGWGIAQWTGGRREALRSAVEKAGLPYNDSTEVQLSAEENDALLSFQLEYMVNESQERTMRDDPNTKEWDGLKAVSGVEEAVEYWQYNYERPGVLATTERIEAAKDILSQYGSNTATSNGSTCDSGGGSGVIVGGFSLPVDQKWFDQHKNWFTKPHHDYPAADIPVPDGTKIYSMTAGKVIKAPIVKGNSSYGQGVQIQASDGTIFIYAHGKDGGSIPGAKEGDTVSAGQLIMHSSYTGNVSPPGPAGAHLHLEIRPAGAGFEGVVCPQDLLVAIGEKRAEIPAIGDLPRNGCTY